MFSDSNLKLTRYLTDILSISISWYAAYALRFYLIPNAQQGIGLLFIQILPILILTSLFIYHRNGLYREERYISTIYEVTAVLKANIFAFIFFVAIIYFSFTDKISRIVFLSYFIISSILVALGRGIYKNILRKARAQGQNLKHILLVGSGKSVEDYIHAARLYKDCGLHFIGWIDSHGKSKDFNIPEFSGSIEEAKKAHSINTIVLGYSGDEATKNTKILQENYNDVIPIQILPDLSYSFIGHQLEEFAGIPLLIYNQPQITQFEFFSKRVFEFVLCFIGVIFISPLLFFIALMVKLSSPGPILYGQERIGLNGKPFMMWKFRSMKVATDDEDNTEWSNKENPRKTKFGDFIRKTSLDELPQLLNVLKGEMSLVGPRPERPFFVEKFKVEIPNYMLRHKLPPGITGWAQINGWRGDTSIEKRIECDIFYIKNYSLYLDIKIIFLTFIKGFINKNAY